MALSDVLRAFASSTASGRAALEAGDKAVQDRRKEVTDELLNALQNIPRTDPRFEQIRARLVQIDPVRFGMPTSPGAVQNERGFVQNVPGGIAPTTTENPDFATARKEKAALQGKRTAAARRIQALAPELGDRTQGFLTQAMNSDDPLAVLKDARAAANTRTEKGETKQSLAARRRAAVAAIKTVKGLSASQREAFMTQARATDDPEQLVKEARQTGGELQVAGTSNEPTALETQLQEEVGSEFIADRSAAKDAVTSLQASVEAERLLDEGIVSGFGANFLVGMGLALRQAGFNVGGTAIENSQAFAANQAQETARIIKQFGAGTGLSDADREFALKAAAGDITMDEQAIRDIIRINREASMAVLKRVNQRAEDLASDRVPIELLRVRVPEFGFLDQSEEKAKKNEGEIDFGDM